MARHLIIGAGPVGTSVAKHLVGAGHDVTMLTRSGTLPPVTGVTAVAGDASDVDVVAVHATGAAAIYNCANPPYHRWASTWPPLAASLLDAAERSGARLVTASNLYAAAPGSSPMSANDPLDPPSTKGLVRAQMWWDALERHEAGRVEVTEVRGSDFVGPDVGDGGHLGRRFVDAVLRGSSPWYVGAPDVTHSWTFVDDMGRTLATAGTHDRAAGRVWHAPTAPACSAQAMADSIARTAELPTVRVRRIPRAALRVVGVVSPLVRELPEVLYQFEEPFVIDATETVETFGFDHTPVPAQLRSIVAASPHAPASLADLPISHSANV